MVKACALAATLALGVTAISAAAFADRGHGMFERSDKDGDGFVTRVEFNASRAVMFARLDSSGDGAIDQSEVDAMRAKFHQRHHKPDAAKLGADKPEMAKKHPSFMARIDTNGDGRIGGAEFAAAGDRIFMKLDGNADGRLALDEMPRHHKRGAETAPSDGQAPGTMPTPQ